MTVTTALEKNNEIADNQGVLPEHLREVFSKSTCLYSKNEVEAALDQLATKISYQCGHLDPIFLCVVVGGIVVLGNLLPRMNFHLELDYVHATRYEKGTSGKNLSWKMTPTTSLKGRTVVVVDDILDGGVTLDAIVSYCRDQGAKDVLTAVLVDKQNARLPEGLQKADFSGLTTENLFLFGYGMDYKGYFRNAPGIYAIDPEHM